MAGIAVNFVGAMMIRSWSVLICTLVLGCVGDTGNDSKNSASNQPVSELNPIAVEAADLIGEAVSSCENQLLNGWLDEVNQFVDANWEAIQASVPATEPVQLSGGTLVSYGSSPLDDFFQRYSLPSGATFTIAVTGETTYARVNGAFSLLVIQELTPNELDSYFTSRFECYVSDKTSVVSSVNMASRSEWSLQITSPSYVEKPQVVIDKVSGPGNTSVTACLGGVCAENRLDDRFNEYSASLSGAQILIAGFQVQLKGGGEVEELVISQQVFDVAVASD